MAFRRIARKDRRTPKRQEFWFDRGDVNPLPKAETAKLKRRKPKVIDK